MGVKVGVICDTLCSSKCRMGSVKLFLSSHLLKGWGRKSDYLPPPCKGVSLLPRASAHAYSLHIWAKMTKIVV